MRCTALAALAGDRVGAEEHDLVDELGAPQVLQHGVHLAGLHGPPERPAGAVGPAGQRGVVAVEREQRVALQLLGRGPRRGDERRHDGDALVVRRLDD